MSSGYITTELLSVTGGWLVPFSLYNIFLSIRVAYQRIQNKKAMGDRSADTPADKLGDDPLYVATRCHQNFLEYVPLGFLLCAAIEINGRAHPDVFIPKHLNVFMAMFFTLRVVHVEFGLLRPNATGLGRKVGYAGTLVWLLAMTARCGTMIQGN